MPIDNPTALVDEFKRIGEFDRLRRQLMAEFQAHDAFPAFKQRIEEVVKQRLQSDDILLHVDQATAHKELMQELDRFPVVEGALTEVKTLAARQDFLDNIDNSIKKIIRESGGEIEEYSEKLADNPTDPAKSTQEPAKQASAEPVPVSAPADTGGLSEEQQPKLNSTDVEMTDDGVLKSTEIIQSS